MDIARRFHLSWCPAAQGTFVEGPEEPQNKVPSSANKAYTTQREFDIVEGL
jgi:hypothetical protein